MTDFKETPQGNDRLTIPEQFRQRFNQLAEGIYPQAVIASIRQENYNPIIIGYDHPSNLSDLPQVKKRFEAIQQAHPEPQIKVALEIIPPVQLKWIKDFLPLEKEYKKHGTVHGEVPRQTPD